MWLIFLIGFLCAETLTANKVYLVKDQKTQNAEEFLDVFSASDGSGQLFSTSPSPHSFGWLGVCLFTDPGQICESQSDAHPSIMNAFYRSIGQWEFRGDINLAGVPRGVFQVESQWVDAGDFLDVTVKKTLDNRYFQGQFRLSPFGSLSLRQVYLDFPQSVFSKRQSIQQQGGRFLAVNEAVVQIASGPVDQKNLLGRVVKSGTGFFVSEDGLMLTNNHVIASYPDCVKFLQCQLKLKQRLSEDNYQQYDVFAEVYLNDESYDVALLKVELPFSVNPIKLENGKIGPDVLTIGYPGDRSFAGGIDVTFSFGKLAGFKAKSFSTTAFVYPGASGSPLLNRSNLKLIGIISDIQGNPNEGKGNPAIARPIDIIDDDFGIRKYITYEKQQKIDQLIAQLRRTKNVGSAKKLLSDFEKQRSYYQISQMHELVISHPNAGIRRQIYKTLQNLNLIRGRYLVPNPGDGALSAGLQ